MPNHASRTISVSLTQLQRLSVASRVLAAVVGRLRVRERRRYLPVARLADAARRCGADHDVGELRALCRRSRVDVRALARRASPGSARSVPIGLCGALAWLIGSPAVTPSFRQSITGLHTWAGLLCGWRAVLRLLDGNPRLLRHRDRLLDAPRGAAARRKINTARAIALRRTTHRVGSTRRTEQFIIYPPSGRDIPEISVFWRTTPSATGTAASRSEVLDRTTGLPIAARATGGGTALYDALRAALLADQRRLLDRRNLHDVHARRDRQRHRRTQADLPRLLHVPAGQGPTLVARRAQRARRAGTAVPSHDHLQRLHLLLLHLHAIGRRGGLRCRQRRAAGILFRGISQRRDGARGRCGAVGAADRNGRASRAELGRRRDPFDRRAARRRRQRARDVHARTRDADEQRRAHRVRRRDGHSLAERRRRAARPTTRQRHPDEPARRLVRRHGGALALPLPARSARR